MLLLLHHPLNVKRKGVKYSSGGEYRLQPLQKVEWIKMRSALTSDRPITPNKILERSRKRNVNKKYATLSILHSGPRARDREEMGIAQCHCAK